jgi:malate dehydrogenase (oxaloacetate-decarboxylating)(NADP+)
VTGLIATGMRRQWPSTEELYAFVDEFVEAVQEVFPNCCIHFEDWTETDAIALLAAPSLSQRS